MSDAPKKTDAKPFGVTAADVTAALSLSTSRDGRPALIDGAVMTPKAFNEAAATMGAIASLAANVPVDAMRATVDQAAAILGVQSTYDLAAMRGILEAFREFRDKVRPLAEELEPDPADDAPSGGLTTKNASAIVDTDSGPLIGRKS